MSDYNGKVRRTQGGDDLTVESGGTITIESGGALNIAAAGGIDPGVVADANTAPAIACVHRIDIADAASGDVDVVLTKKERVIDVVVVKTGGAGGAANTVQVKNGANAITDAISINIADKAVARAAEIDDAQHEIAAAGTLRVTRTKAGGNAACTVYVHTLRVS